MSHSGGNFMIAQVSKPKSLYFTIEGNIGCGKSTFVQKLKEKVSQLHWIEEPVKEWQSLGNTQVNMLERYYSEPTRWGFTFQIYAIFTRLKCMQQACERFPNKLKISERSILADKHVFAQIMRQLKFMDEAEYEVYKSLYKSFETMAPINEAKIIYLRCTPEKCQQRTLLRKRPQQKEIPFSYLQMLHQKHQAWFKQCDPEKVLIIDTTEDFKDNQDKIEEMFEKLNKFIGHHE